MIIGNKDEILVRIGDAVKNERLRQNITQAVLAERSGVSLNAVKHLESGSGVTLGTFVLYCAKIPGSARSWNRVAKSAPLNLWRT